MEISGRDRSLLAVVEAIDNLCQRIHSPIFSVSVRQLAELAGISRSAAQRALQKLMMMNEIEKVSEAEGTIGLAATYKIAHTGTYFSLLKHKINKYSVPLCDVFVHHPTARRIYGWLTCNGSGTVSEIAAALDLHPTTVRRHLKNMNNINIIIKAGRRYEVNQSTSLEEAAESTGTTGAIESMKQKHESERKIYKEMNDRQLYLTHIFFNEGDLKQNANYYYINVSRKYPHYGIETFVIRKTNLPLVEKLTTLPHGTLLRIYAFPETYNNSVRYMVHELYTEEEVVAVLNDDSESTKAAIQNMLDTCLNTLSKTVVENVV